MEIAAFHGWYSLFVVKRIVIVAPEEKEYATSVCDASDIGKRRTAERSDLKGRISARLNKK